MTKKKKKGQEADDAILANAIVRQHEAMELFILDGPRPVSGPYLGFGHEPYDFKCQP